MTQGIIKFSCEVSDEEWNRFQKYIEPDTNGGCWLWSGATQGHVPYGAFRVKGPRRQVKAHRVSYIRAKGLIPDGLTIDHKCRQTLCVNPDHLEAVTHKENIRRQPNFLGNRTECPQGHEYTTENTKIYRGSRFCRVCHRIKQSEYMTKKKARLLAVDYL